MLHELKAQVRPASASSVLVCGLASNSTALVAQRKDFRIRSSWSWAGHGMQCKMQKLLRAWPLPGARRL